MCIGESKMLEPVSSSKIYLKPDLSPVDPTVSPEPRASPSARYHGHTHANAFKNVQVTVSHSIHITKYLAHISFIQLFPLYIYVLLLIKNLSFSRLSWRNGSRSRDQATVVHQRSHLIVTGRNTTIFNTINPVITYCPPPRQRGVQVPRFGPLWINRHASGRHSFAVEVRRWKK